MSFRRYPFATSDRAVLDAKVGSRRQFYLRSLVLVPALTVIWGRFRGRDEAKIKAEVVRGLLSMSASQAVYELASAQYRRGLSAECLTEPRAEVVSDIDLRNLVNISGAAIGVSILAKYGETRSPKQAVRSGALLGAVYSLPLAVMLGQRWHVGRRSGRLDQALDAELDFRRARDTERNLAADPVLDARLRRILAEDGSDQRSGDLEIDPNDVRSDRSGKPDPFEA